MAKASIVSIKAGSFVDRLASKRRQKEAMEQDLANVQQEVDVLKQEVAHCEAMDQDFDRMLAEQYIFFQQRTKDFEALSVQLVAVRESLQSATQRDA